MSLNSILSFISVSVQFKTQKPWRISLRPAITKKSILILQLLPIRCTILQNKNRKFIFRWLRWWFSNDIQLNYWIYLLFINNYHNEEFTTYFIKTFQWKSSLLMHISKYKYTFHYCIRLIIFISKPVTMASILHKIWWCINTFTTKVSNYYMSEAKLIPLCSIYVVRFQFLSCTI